MGMFDDLPDIRPAPGGGMTPRSAPRGMFDDLPDIKENSPQWPPQLNTPAPTTPQEKKFAQELRAKADRMLVGDAGPMTAATVAAANTFGINLPRKAGSYLRSLQTGNTPESEYQRLKAEDEALARLYPKADFAGSAAGALAQAPLFPGAPAASVAGRAAQSAALGGLLSGSAEFVDTGNADAANRAALGGAVFGGAGSPVVDALGRVVGAVGRPLINTARGVINPEAEAGRRVTQALSNDLNAGNIRLDPNQWRGALAEGQPVVLGDVGGETTKALARSAANTSPEARDSLKRITSDRFGNQNERIGAFIQDFGSGQNAVETSDQLARAARAANKPAYEAAYNSPNAQAVWNDDLAQLMQAPSVQSAVSQAMRTGANKAAAQGFKPPSNPFIKDASGNFVLKTNPDGSQAVPSLQFWDYVQRNLSDQIGTLSRKGAKSASSDAIQLRNQLNEILDSSVPEFGAARAGAARFFGAQDALEAGQKFVNSNINNMEARKAIQKMTRPERQLFAEGFISDLTDKVRAVADRQNVLGKIFQSPKQRERVQLALGPQRTRQLEAYLHVERVMDELRTAVSGNSTTARQLAEAGLAGGAAGGILGGNDPTDVSLGAVLGAASKRFHLGVDARVARRVGEMLASNDTDVVKKAVAMAVNNKKIIDLLRKAQVSILGSGAAAYEGR